MVDGFRPSVDDLGALVEDEEVSPGGAADREVRDDGDLVRS